MCGIGGIIQRNRRIERSELDDIIRGLKHRGPDGDGVFLNQDHSVGLVHTRLSILDLSDVAAQPMENQDGSLVIAFNGEVFNFIEIKADLVKLGYGFKTESDTEVVLKAYQEWGLQAFDRFNGMWAIVLYHRESDEVLLIRDRFGIKPLYLLLEDAFTAFASETNVFKQLGNYRRSFDDDVLLDALHDPNSLEGSGRTIFKNIIPLPSGHYVWLSKSRPIAFKRWYSISDHLSDLSDLSEKEVKEQLLTLLKDSVAIRMRSDVDIATALSGGLDSSSVYALVSEQCGLGVGDRLPKSYNKAFVAVFPGQEQDEKAYAQSVLNHVKGSGVFVDVPEQMTGKNIKEITEHFDRISYQPMFSHVAIYRAIKANGYTISLDGHGVDEMLFGYRDMVSGLYENEKAYGQRKLALSYGRLLSSMYPSSMTDKKWTDFKRDVEYAFRWQAAIKRTARRVLGKGQNSFGYDGEPRFPTDYNFSDLSIDQRIPLIEFFQRTLPDLLVAFDKAAMMNGVEIRMPFMDYRLVELLHSLPVHLRLHGNLTKGILRQAMSNSLPPDITFRTSKVGLQSPALDLVEDQFKNHLSDGMSWYQDKLELSNKVFKDQIGKRNIAWPLINLQLLRNEFA
jgi:asparagine synthase (glutamine-hydrolysing)